MEQETVDKEKMNRQPDSGGEELTSPFGKGPDSPAGACCSLACHMKKLEPLTWWYLCHKCNEDFEIQVPKGPKEERAIRCPLCGGDDIERIRIYECEASMPGG